MLRWRWTERKATIILCHKQRGNGFVASLCAHCIVPVIGNPSGFHLDYSHFLKFQKQQGGREREREREKERESMSVRLSLSHLLAFLLTAFEEAMGSERCLH